MEADHFKREDLHSKVHRAPEGDGQVDLPEGYRSMPGDDTVERRARRPDPQAVDAHGIEGLGVEDVEAAASVHKDFGEPLGADDGVDDQWELSQPMDAPWVVRAIEVIGASDHFRKLGAAGSAE